MDRYGLIQGISYKSDALYPSNDKMQGPGIHVHEIISRSASAQQKCDGTAGELNHKQHLLPRESSGSTRRYISPIQKPSAVISISTPMNIYFNFITKKLLKGLLARRSSRPFGARRGVNAYSLTVHIESVPSCL